jgi:hypothetical protein
LRTSLAGEKLAPIARGGELIRPDHGGRKSLIGLGCVWVAVLGLHLILRLPDVWLWIGFPALFLPWLLFGPSNWFDR